MTGMKHVLIALTCVAALIGCGGADEPSPAFQSTTTGNAEIAFTSDPVTPTIGQNTFEVRVTEAGAPVNDAQVSVEFFMPAMPSMNMAERRNRSDLQPAGDGTYRGTGQVMMSGNWEVTVRATRNGQEIGTRSFPVTAR